MWQELNMSKVGYGPVIGRSPEGFPVYLYTNPESKLTTYIVVLPDGRAFYSDRGGRIVSDIREASPAVEVLAILGGLLGLVIGGAPGAVLGGLAGAALGQVAKKPAK